MMSKPIIVGHRANTFRAIHRYLKLGVPVLEFDVKRKDNKLILMHGMIGEPASLTESLLLELHYILCSGDSIVKHVTLEEALDIINGKAGVWLDIKDRGIESDIVKVIDKVNFKGPIYASSKYHAVVRNLKKAMPEIIGAITLNEQPVDPITLVKRANADMVSIEHTCVDREFIEILHKNSIGVAVWTVNQISEAEKLISMGVDVIITDKPDIILKALGKRIPKSNTPFFQSILLLLTSIIVLIYCLYGVSDLESVVGYYSFCDEPY
ncbi:MAG TPA: glycerophosphodiester phosphodiesterase [Desulfurococcales archaeon]|nr:glycerophosphodiester phosphodiesterase [Desulfurococcales archaeon]